MIQIQDFALFFYLSTQSESQTQYLLEKLYSYSNSQASLSEQSLWAHAVYSKRNIKHAYIPKNTVDTPEWLFLGENADLATWKSFAHHASDILVEATILHFFYKKNYLEISEILKSTSGGAEIIIADALIKIGSIRLGQISTAQGSKKGTFFAKKKKDYSTKDLSFIQKNFFKSSPASHEVLALRCYLGDKKLSSDDSEFLNAYKLVTSAIEYLDVLSEIKIINEKIILPEPDKILTLWDRYGLWFNPFTYKGVWIYPSLLLVFMLTRYGFENQKNRDLAFEQEVVRQEISRFGRLAGETEVVIADEKTDESLRTNLAYLGSKEEVSQVGNLNRDLKLSQIKSNPSPGDKVKNIETTISLSLKAPVKTGDDDSKNSNEPRVLVSNQNKREPSAVTLEKNKIDTGFVYKGELILDGNKLSEYEGWKKMLVQEGAKKAGQVELGWAKNSNTQYYHFSVKENSQELIKNQLLGMGNFKFEKLPHPRKMPKGFVRFIVEIKNVDSISKIEKGQDHEGKSMSPSSSPNDL